MVKVIFLGGAYRSPDGGTDGIYENLHHIRTINKHLCRAGYAVICPNLSFAFSDGFITDFDKLLEGTKELLLRSDLAIFASTALTSSGSKEEKEHAKKHNKFYLQLPKRISEVYEAEEAVSQANTYFFSKDQYNA